MARKKESVSAASSDSIMPLTPPRRPLGIPVVEASSVKLDRLHALADPLHHELTLDGEVAGAARSVIPGSAPDGRDAVLRQASISKLFSDEGSEGVLFHGGLPRVGAGRKATFTGVSTLNERQPERPRCRR